ncbi:MAG: TonB-dependent receptor plug domain-containing protein, partial [Alphaproteobacteria bacterium]|nr:TonB-dependent receptor plug domain-containing protein [Alphaproteobacteria bacterium]
MSLDARAQDTASEMVVLPPIDIIAAPRLGGLGGADTASEGYVAPTQIEQQPRYRVGEILETVPGLIVTQHSGEGKANQYFLRGFNLDH